MGERRFFVNLISRLSLLNFKMERWLSWLKALDSKSTRSVALIMPETLEFPWVCEILKI